MVTAARQYDSGTSVVGRSAYPWLLELFQSHTADKLVFSAGIAVCVVD